jgi:hypothetical protein
LGPPQRILRGCKIEYSQVANKGAGKGKVPVGDCIGNSVDVTRHVTDMNIQGRASVHINGREEVVVRGFRMEGVEHMDSVHVVRVHQETIKFGGKVSCSDVSCMMNGGTDHKSF